MDTIQELAEEILNVLDMKRKGRVDAFPELSANEYLEHQLQAVRDAERDAERERCAKIAEGYGEFDLTDLFDDGYETGMAIVAAAIREGG